MVVGKPGALFSWLSQSITTFSIISSNLSTPPIKAFRLPNQQPLCYPNLPGHPFCRLLYRKPQCRYIVIGP